MIKTSAPYRALGEAGGAGPELRLGSFVAQLDGSRVGKGDVMGDRELRAELIAQAYRVTTAVRSPSRVIRPVIDMPHRPWEGQCSEGPAPPGEVEGGTPVSAEYPIYVVVVDTGEDVALGRVHG